MPQELVSPVPNRVVFQDCRILFRNFSGREGQYNREGQRNFTLVLDNDIAAQMQEDGWNIKYLRPRDIDEEPQAIVNVEVSYKKRPPRIVLITQHHGSLVKTDVPEDLLNILDWVEIANVDLILNPSHWEVSGKSGIKAYLGSIYITILQDELEQKYSDVPESAQNILESTGTLEIEAGEDPNIIDAEIVEDDEF